MIESAIMFVFFVVLRITAGVYAKSFTWLSKTIIPLDIICCIIAALVIILIILTLVGEIKKAVMNSKEAKTKRTEHNAAVLPIRENRRQNKSPKKKKRKKKKGAKK